ncbi:TniQ family protein [Spirillospora sp. CA-253888]
MTPVAGTARPLARSLVPLADESLPGFLLRLAHRLDQPPTEIALHTGLGGASGTPVISIHNLLQMTAPTAHRFARRCRLTAMETAALGMARPGGPYPPLDLVARGQTQLRHTTGIPGLWNWVFTRATRYCPQCLAGDGSPIQQQHGGAWAGSWRLPVVFACLRHQRLLASLCPDCGQDVQARSPREQGLIPAADTMLHPAQCRSPLIPEQPAASHTRHRHPRPRCGTLLSAGPINAGSTGAGSTGPAAPPLDHALLDLQRRLLALFTDSALTDFPFTGSVGTPPAPATSVGRLVTAQQYFVDLRLMTVLVQLTWPHAAPLITSPSLADALDTHLHRQQRDREAYLDQGRRPAVSLHPGAPPADTAACAAMLQAATRLLDDQACAEAEQALAALIERAFGQRTWHAVVRQSRLWCSPGLDVRIQKRMAQLRPPSRRGTVTGNRRHCPARGWLDYHRVDPVAQPDRPYRYQRQHVPST